MGPAQKTSGRTKPGSPTFRGILSLRSRVRPPGLSTVALEQDAPDHHPDKDQAKAQLGHDDKAQRDRGDRDGQAAQGVDELRSLLGRPEGDPTINPNTTTIRKTNDPLSMMTFPPAAARAGSTRRVDAPGAQHLLNLALNHTLQRFGHGAYGIPTSLGCRTATRPFLRRMRRAKGKDPTRAIRRPAWRRPLVRSSASRRA